MDDVKRITRRSFHRAAVTATVGFMVGPHRARARTRSGDFTLKYALASSMYGYKTLEMIVPEVHKIGVSSIDLWPKPHGNQREQLDSMGTSDFWSCSRSTKSRWAASRDMDSVPSGFKKKYDWPRASGVVSW